MSVDLDFVVLVHTYPSQHVGHSSVDEIKDELNGWRSDRVGWKQQIWHVFLPTHHLVDVVGAGSQHEPVNGDNVIANIDLEVKVNFSLLKKHISIDMTVG